MTNDLSLTTVMNRHIFHKIKPYGKVSWIDVPEDTEIVTYENIRLCVGWARYILPKGTRFQILANTDLRRIAFCYSSTYNLYEKWDIFVKTEKHQLVYDFAMACFVVARLIA